AIEIMKQSYRRIAFYNSLWPQYSENGGGRIRIRLTFHSQRIQLRPLKMPLDMVTDLMADNEKKVSLSKLIADSTISFFFFTRLITQPLMILPWKITRLSIAKADISVCTQIVVCR